MKNIAFIGEFSSGKSTLINALIGRDLLKHSAYETTIMTVSIVNVEKNDKKNHSLEIFYKTGEIEKSDFKNVINLTTTSSTGGYEDVEKVVIYLHFSGEELTFIDTPGLNSIIDFYKEKTYNVALTADICVYVLSRPVLSASDIKFLKKIVKQQKDFIFAVSFADTMTGNIDEFGIGINGLSLNPQNKEMLRLEKQIKLIFPDINYEIVFVSGLKALAGRDKSIKKLYYGDTAEIKSCDRERFVNESNIHELEKFIKNFVPSEKILPEEKEKIKDTVKRNAKEHFMSLGFDEEYLTELEKVLTKKYAAEIRGKIQAAIKSGEYSVKVANEKLVNYISEYRNKIREDINKSLKDVFKYIKNIEYEKFQLKTNKPTSIDVYNFATFISDETLPDVETISELLAEDDFILLPKNNDNSQED